MKKLAILLLMSLTSFAAFGQEQAVEMKGLKYAVKVIKADEIRKAFEPAMLKFYQNDHIDSDSIMVTDPELYINPTFENIHNVAVQNLENIELFEDKQCGKVEVSFWTSTLGRNYMQPWISMSKKVGSNGTYADTLSNVAYNYESKQIKKEDKESLRECLDKAYKKIREGVVGFVAVIGVPKKEYIKAKGESIHAVKTSFVNNEIRRLSKLIESHKETLSQLEQSRDLQK